MKKLNNHIMDSKSKTDEQISFDRKMKEMHSSALGLKTPENYFSASKMEILEKVSTQKEKRFYLFSRKRIVWAAAASIAIIFAVSVFKPNVLPSFNNVPAIVSDTVELFQNNNLAQGEFKEDDILITSLFVPDNEIDEFVNNYVLEELVYDEVMPN
ncbi:MAG: hypothetical protein APF83_03440 [Lutibacter sp. BRH_c52]|nr:MAG: hypothetical protein APF83_03440 [Lutibacter sp. BRH_c52]